MYIIIIYNSIIKTNTGTDIDYWQWISGVSAIADTLGGGGLLNEGSGNRLSIKNSYLLMSAAGIFFASKAFAAYYVLQLLIGCLILKIEKHIPQNRATFAMFLGLFILMYGVIIAGAPLA